MDTGTAGNDTQVHGEAAENDVDCNCETLDLDCEWDGESHASAIWTATKPWPHKVFLRYYDVGTPVQKNGRKFVTYRCRNGSATYEVVEDDYGDFIGTLQGGSSYRQCAN